MDGWAGVAAVLGAALVACGGPDAITGAWQSGLGPTQAAWAPGTVDVPALRHPLFVGRWIAWRW
jgi:hypothetical protein